MKWSKKLSITDAQQKTSGYKVPYLRLTKGRNPQDNQTWFRNTMLAGEAWTPGVFGQHHVEQCHIDVDVTIAGQPRGTRKFLITHDGSRMGNNKAPNTWLHYDTATIADLNAVNYTGSTATFQKNGSKYELLIS